jgi:hypothetical protein
MIEIGESVKLLVRFGKCMCIGAQVWVIVWVIEFAMVLVGVVIDQLVDNRREHHHFMVSCLSTPEFLRKEGIKPMELERVLLILE